MKERIVSILGEEVKITFNMAVEIAYEEICNKPFDMETLSKTKNTAILYAATILANNPTSDITIDDILYRASLPEISELRTAVIESMSEWMQIPEVMKDDAPKKDEEETKNV